MILEKYRSEFNHCLHCHLCYAANWHKTDDWAPVCPTAARFGFESFHAPGRIEIARALLEGKLKEATPRLLEVLYTCTGCGACTVQCHDYSGVKFDQVELFEDMKALCVSEGWGPLPKHREFARSIAENHNPYQEPHANRFAWLSKEVPSGNPIVYFVGCTSSYRQKEIALATVKVLEASGTPFTVLGPDEWCCGSPLIRTGQVESIRDLAAHNIEVLEKMGAKTVIFSCAGCFNTFKNDYPKLGFKLPFRIRHTTQFFMDLLRKDKLKIKALPKVITYHDPCHLGHHARVYLPPRRVLNKLQVKLKEMPRSLKDSFCCGAGSGVRAAYPDFTKWVAKNRLDEVNTTGVEVLASACPFCKNNFIEALKDYSDFQIEVLDISELVAEALDE